MREVRTVTLELLRSGAAHGRLLSPDTGYLALCGNHPPETFHVPLEHRTFLANLGHLRYGDRATPAGREAREAHLGETSRLLARVLGEIPGLLAELSSHSREPAPLVHLQLVLSSHELSMLPFELSEAPNGFPGAGQPLVLQSQLPLVITRQVRRVGNRPFRWPREPRILFVAANPDGSTVPADAHRLLLERTLEPWIGHHPRGRAAALAEHLTVLESASVDSLEAACADTAYSHVHILAHGRELRVGGAVHYGLDFHHPTKSGQGEVVDGERLALALTSGAEERGDRGPAVVTLASCDGGNVGSVVDGTASLAHALHQAGVPMVVASQFPLSKGGSKVLVEELYGPLLWGEDPRFALRRLRQQLRLHRPTTHDWASLVIYTTLPDDLDDQLRRHRVRQAQRAVDVAHDWADQLLVSLGPDDGESSTPSVELEERLKAVLRRLQKGQERLKTVAQETPIWGRMASAAKREAQVLFRVCRLLDCRAQASVRGDGSRGPDGEDFVHDGPSRVEYVQESRKALVEARDYYHQAFRSDFGASWAVGQLLCLDEVLGRRSTNALDLWTTARTTAEIDLASARGRSVAWARSTLLELHLLAFALWQPTGSRTRRAKLAEHRDQALLHARELADLMADHALDIYTTRRQLLRYPSWFVHVDESGTLVRTLPLVEELVAVLPDCGPGGKR
ncbi:MAG: CHAT domain-containing protein [Acidobacteriota bacterium]